MLGQGQRGRIHRFAAAATVALAVAATAGLLAPLTGLAVAGISPTGMTEESTGYRYFYSLRLLYAVNERPWLPQGHLIGIAHHLIQLALTAFGYAPTQIVPRVVLFGYIAAALPHLVTGVALWWALRAISSLLGRTAVAAAVPAVMLAPALTGGYHLLLPDYYSWIHALAMVSLGCCLRLTAPGTLASTRWATGLGLLLGLCVAVKVTVVALAMPPLVLLLLSPGQSLRRRAIWLLIVAAVSATTYLAALLLYYLGDGRSVVRYFVLLRQFSADEQSGQTPALLTWALNELLGGAPLLSKLSVALPFLLAGSLLLPVRRVSLGLLLGAAAVLLVLWRRPLPTTLIETYDYLLLALPLWTVRVGWPIARSLLARLHIHAQGWPVLIAGSGLVLVGLVIPAVERALDAQPMFVPTFRQANEIERALNDLIAAEPGPVAIVTLGNSHRPVTGDSAIFKGGTNHGESDIWGVSPFMMGLVPDRRYFYAPTDRPQRPVDLTGFTYLFFVSLQPPEQLEATRRQLARVFHISLVGFDCPVALPMPTGGHQYGCKRRTDAVVSEQPGQIAFVPDTAGLTPASPVTWARGQARTLRPGDTVYAALSRELWRLETDGSFTRLRGAPGQPLAIGAIGPWSVADGAIQPLMATADGVTWTVDTSPMPSANTNPGLQTSERSNRPDGWAVLGGQQVTPTRRQDGDGWLELRAVSSGAEVGVRTAAALGPAGGGPVTAIISVRGIGAGAIQARLTRTAASGSAAPADDLTVSQTPDGDWQTLALHLPPSETPANGLELSIHLDPTKAGDRLDIRSAAIYSGRHP